MLNIKFFVLSVIHFFHVNIQCMCNQVSPWQDVTVHVFVVMQFDDVQSLAFVGIGTAANQGVAPERLHQTSCLHRAVLDGR